MSDKILKLPFNEPDFVKAMGREFEVKKQGRGLKEGEKDEKQI